jgi:hypothetical protein
MKFCNQQHKYCCGVDPHARNVYVLFLNIKGKVVLHQNMYSDVKEVRYGFHPPRWLIRILNFPLHLFSFRCRQYPAPIILIVFFYVRKSYRQDTIGNFARAILSLFFITVF